MTVTPNEKGLKIWGSCIIIPYRSLRNTEVSKGLEEGFHRASYPAWERGTPKSDENRRPGLLENHRENQGALEEGREFAKEPAMHTWKEDGFE